MKKIIKMLMLASVITITGCESHPTFKDPADALQGCRKTLDALKAERNVDAKKLTDLTANWLETQDSAYSAFSKDSTVTFRNPIALAYFMVSDSIRDQISRLASERQRTLSDVMYLKLNAVKDKEKIHGSQTYKDAISFFNELDKKETLPSLEKTIPIYMKLLKNTKDIKTEGQLLSFMSKEDICFRSIMQDLYRMPTSRLQQLTEATNSALDGLYSIVSSGHNKVNDRTMLYLTMRFNRRIIQYANACKNDVLNNRKLTQEQKANYRWMLIQPYMAIDDYSTATLTDAQQKELMQLSEDLPELLKKLETEKSVKTDSENLTKVLSDYFLKSFISTTL